ncbi:MAG: TlpA disulfide reductase family protein, partial [Novosphingobium sp.]
MLLSRSLKLAVLASAVVAAGCDRQGSDSAQPQATPSASANSAAPAVPKGAIDRSHKGSLMPELVLSDPAGRQLRLSTLKGKPVLVNLWATWCAPCVTELPMLDTLAGQGKLRVLTVSQDMGEPEKVAAFLADRKLTALEPWLDPQNDLSFHYGTGTLPTTILYDAQGREIWRFIGE